MRNLKGFKTIAAVALTLVMLLGLFACGGQGSGSGSGGSGATGGGANTGEKTKIGVIQLLEHTALSSSRQGFIDALKDNGYVDGENITLDIQIGSGDANNLSTIADQLISEENSLILAIATPAAQAVAGKTSTIPILGTAITDYEVAGLVDSNDMPGRNVSGTTDMNPISEQLDLLIKLVPDVQTVGFIYSSNEDNSRLQIDLAKKYLDTKGIAYKEVTIANSNDVQQATTSLVGQVDAIYVPTDNVIASTMPTVNSIAAPAGIPVICGEQGEVENGGLATLGISYYDLGYETGLMAVKVLKGEDVSKMPIQASKKFDYYINGAVAEQTGVTIPTDLQQYVK